jgi:hypothetical protein
MLAAFGRCEEAEPVMSELESVYGGDDTIMGIVNENRAVCAIFAENEAGN